MLPVMAAPGLSSGGAEAAGFHLQVTVNWFQLQQAQVVSLPVNHQSLCENAKLYEPGQRYVDFVRSLPGHGPRPEPHPLDSQNAG